MNIPEDPNEKRNFVRWLIDNCVASKQERRALYDKRRRYYLYGKDANEIVRFNKLKSHLALLTSFLYAPDQISYAISAPHNASDDVAAQYLAIEDDWNSDFTDCGLADAYDEALLWATVYDTMILKTGWNDLTGQEFAQLVEPAAFGVFQEYVGDLNSQQAMCHTFVLDYDDARERMVRAGLASDIPKLKEVGGGSSDIGLPAMLQQMIISATGGPNFQGNVQGEINPNYEAGPTYTAKLTHNVVPFHELYVMDGKSKDWRIFHVLDPDFIVSDSKATIHALKQTGRHKVKPPYDSETNFFLKHEHPFTAVTPWPLYNYVWGDCHLEDLIPLQNWLTERLTQIDEILEMQVDPAKDFAGFTGMDDERLGAWGGPGTFVQDPLPGAKATSHYPTMPEDVFREFDTIQALFMEQSGFTEIMAGRGEKNVRGRGHARELKTTGAGRVRKVAAGLEKSLTRYADIGLKLKAKNDDTVLRTPGIDGKPGKEFVLAQVLGESDYQIRVSGHSHSPLFTMESTETAFALFKAQSIDREWLLRLIKPPHMRDLINALRKRLIAEQQARQQMAAQGLRANGKSAPKPLNGAGAGA